MFQTLVLTTLLASSLTASPRDDMQAVVESYCLGCHGGGRPKGGVDLEPLLESGGPDLALLVRVAQVVEDERMPPPRRPQPSELERSALLSAIESTLVAARAAEPDRLVLRRLSQREYANTIRDLLGVELPDEISFPADGSGGEGFDNHADSLFLPPLLMERYLEAAAACVKASSLGMGLARASGTTELERARSMLSDFARRATRRPLEEETLDRLAALYSRARWAQRSPTESLELAARAVLVSPSFLFRIEHVRGARDDFELASRLSYFLWSSMPDTELLALAKRSVLRQPIVLEAQIDRMLRDARFRDAAEDFVVQWLGLESLRTTVQPNRRLFPSYSVDLREAMIEEAVEVFHAILGGEGNLLDLLDGESTFLNEELAQHYGIAGVEGPAFRRVPLPDRRRGGLLGLAAVQTVTSYSRRTSPVLRGQWVLDKILGSPAPPPPANTKSLSEDDRPAEGQTFRQRLEAHRAKPQCASCHQRMDPIGFGLENFDPIGRWRTDIGGQSVDATGELVTGESFEGPIALKALLLERRDRFLRTLVRRLLGYALGRSLTPADEPAVRRIAATVTREGHRGPTLVREIARQFLTSSPQ